MDLIEVKVLDASILLPLTDQTTIASITLDALNEYSTFNLKKAPKKVNLKSTANF